MIRKRSLIIMASIACFIGCIGDFCFTFILGNYKPGYSQLLNTMSLLGVTASPVSGIISAWWVVLGFLMILYAVGFGKAFDYHKIPVKIATWLIIIYGVGEGFGSGIFKADHINNSLTLSAIIHEIMGGAGIFAILVLPLVLLKIIPRTTNPGFHRFSLIVFYTGLVLLAFFLVHPFPHESNDLSRYKGLWQRLFVLDYYLYMMVIAVIMIKKQQVKPKLLFL